MFREDHEVVTVGHGPAPDGVAEHIEVPRAYNPLRPNFRHLMALFALRLYRRAYWRSRRIRYVREQVEAGSMDIVLANDVIAVPLALALAPHAGVHADLHEYAPRQREEARWWRALVGPFQSWMVRRYVRRADSVTTVSQGLARQYELEFGVRADVVPNAAPYRGDIEPTAVERPLRLVHMGTSAPGRGIREMIQGVVEAESVAVGTIRLDLYLKGGDAGYRRELEQLVAQHGDVVRLMEPVPYERIVPTLQGYDVGLIIYPPSNFNVIHALPNKLFEYVQARLGVVVGPGEDMRDFVTEHGIGTATISAQPSDVARALAEITDDQVRQWKQASHERASELSDEQTSQPWREAIDALAAKARLER